MMYFFVFIFFITSCVEISRADEGSLVVKDFLAGMVHGYINARAKYDTSTVSVGSTSTEITSMTVAGGQGSLVVQTTKTNGISIPLIGQVTGTNLLTNGACIPMRLLYHPNIFEWSAEALFSHGVGQWAAEAAYAHSKGKGIPVPLNLHILLGAARVIGKNS